MPDTEPTVADPRTRRLVFRRDVTSAVLGIAPRIALSGLLPYIAVNRLGASMGWVGVMNAAIYTGFLWNAFFSRLTARMSLKRSIVVLMAASSALLAVAAFQRTAASYGVVIVLMLFAGGLTNAQYDTFLVYLYEQEERSRKLSLRWMAVSMGAALLSPLFGRMSETGAGHRPALAAAAVLVAAGAVVFVRIPAAGEPRIEPFGLRRLLRLVVDDRRFLRLVVVLVLYGWFGAGIGTIDVVLYRRYGLGELAAGLLSGATTGGMILAAVGITPFLRFRGGLTNFRLCLTAAAGSALILGLAGVLDMDRLGVLLIAGGNLVYGIAATGFTIAAQTSAANLAGGKDVALYVNSFKFFQGVRGVLFPLMVAWAFGILPAAANYSIAFGLTLICAVATWVKGADSR